MMLLYHLKSILTLSILSGMLIGLSSLIGGIEGALFMLALSAIIPLISYFYADKIALRMYKASRLSETDFAWIYTTVKELSDRMHIPMPQLWIIPLPIANAFATGRNPKNGNIALTQGIIALLNRDELQAVLAHELGHIKNHDTFYTTLAVVLANSLSSLVYMIRMNALWGNRDDRSRNNSLLGAFLLSILIPFVALLLQLLLSRTREYMADETGAHACGDPLALASALQKIELNAQSHQATAPQSYAPGSESLFFMFPYRNNWIQELFSTHPSTANRIARLHKLFTQ